MSDEAQILQRMRAERDRLERQIEALQLEVESASTGGIREFRRNRIEQLRDKQMHLQQRQELFEHLHPAASDEADKLWEEMQRSGYASATSVV